MELARSIRGRMARGAIPDWTSLEKLLGDQLCSHFMWMFEVDLEDETRIHVYRHRWTRCVFYLSTDGRAFHAIWHDDDSGEGCYREVKPDAAILVVFAGWESIKPTESERAALHVALRSVQAGTPTARNQRCE